MGHSAAHSVLVRGMSALVDVVPPAFEISGLRVEVVRVWSLGFRVWDSGKRCGA